MKYPRDSFGVWSAGITCQAWLKQSKLLLTSVYSPSSGQSFATYVRLEMLPGSAGPGFPPVPNVICTAGSPRLPVHNCARTRNEEQMESATKTRIFIRQLLEKRSIKNN